MLLPDFGGHDINALCAEAFKTLHAAFLLGPSAPRTPVEEDVAIARFKQAFEHTGRPLTASQKAKKIAMLRTAYGRDGSPLTPNKRAEELASLKESFAKAGVHVHGAHSCTASVLSTLRASGSHQVHRGAFDGELKYLAAQRAS